jgi:pimeloyl-ACP methyl ester carboxylesterase/DNA-binding CsgD family transcriptional regulator
LEPASARKPIDEPRAVDSPSTFLSQIVGLAELRLPEDSDALQQIVARAGREGWSGGGAISLAPGALSVGIFTRTGKLLSADALLTDTIDPDAFEVASFCARVGRERRGLALTPTRDESRVCLLGVSSEVAADWQILDEHVRDRSWAAPFVAILMFAPARSRDSFNQLAQSAGLTPAETRDVWALLQSDTIETASRFTGVKRETMKTNLASAMRRVGAATSTGVIGALISVGSGPLAGAVGSVERLQHLFGLSPAQARFAFEFMRGQSLDDAAAAAGISRNTAKTHQRTIFELLDVKRARALRRLIAEGLALSAMVSMTQVRRDGPATAERLRVLFRGRGRRVAFLDYGGERGELVFVGHGDSTGRTLPEGLVEALVAQGFRPVVVQRPGFGLSSRATEDYLAESSDDMAAVLDLLGQASCSLLMRDGGAATALDFARKYPARVRRAVLLNPRQPNGAGVARGGPFRALREAIQSYPSLIELVSDLLRGQNQSTLLSNALRRACAGSAADSALLRSDAVMSGLVDDIHGLVGVSAAGFVEEHRLFSQGWQPPQGPIGGIWRVAASGDFFADGDRTPWARLPGVQMQVIGGAGLFVQFTHPANVTGLLRD